MSPNNSSMMKRRGMTVEDSRAHGRTGSLNRNYVSQNTEIDVSKYNSEAWNSLRMSSPGIKVPVDMTLKNIVKNKNESIFTNSLLQGDSNGYAIGRGV